MTREEWLESPEGRATARRWKLREAIELALIMPNVPKNQGKTISQVYTELAREFDYELLEVIEMFKELQKGRWIHIVNVNEEASAMASDWQWRIIQ
jgi:hypothetical protein